MENTSDHVLIPETLSPILWVGDASQTEFPKSFRFHGHEIKIIQRASLDEALDLLQKQKFSVVAAEELPGGAGLRLLEQALRLQPMALRFYMGLSFHEAAIRDGINKAKIFRFLKMPLQWEELRLHLERALQKHALYLSRSLLLKEASHKNKQLEALTYSLEKIVEERTQYIEQSHREESDKLSRERQLVRFIKELAAQSSFEDILGILRKELRKFHKLGDPILAYRLEGHKTFFLSFQSGNFTRTQTTHSFAFPHEIGVPAAPLVRHFANHFGRPFVKAWMMPLELRLTRHLMEGKGEAVICIENSLDGKEALSFIDMMNDRRGPLSMALDRVLLESQLSAFSYRWEKTFDGMRDPVAIVDLEYNTVRANRKFSDKFLSHKCFETFADRKSACEGCPVADAIREEKPQVGQIQVKGRIYQVHSYPIRGEQNERITNVVNQYVDITQSRQLYLKMLQSEKIGAIGALAGNIAHELNNPLTGLRSLSQVLLAETEANSTLHADLAEIEKAAARSQRTIRNLLEFSREEQASEFVSVDEIVERTLPMLKSALRSHRTDIDLQSAGQTVFVEPHLLQQVVFNLINNACQAMKEPGRLRVATRCEDGQVILEIEDSGPGIPEEIKSRIFEAFFTTKKEGQGTGLGLSMSKQVIEKFNGRIEFRDVTPRGTCFRISLPQKNKPES